MIKFNKSKMKSVLKTAGGMLAMVTLGVIANSLNIPVDFSFGGRSEEARFDSWTHGYSPRGGKIGVRAIQAIMLRVSCTTSSYDIRRAAEDIYEIVRNNMYEYETVAVGTDALEALMKKVSSEHDKRRISDLIKELATS